MITVKDIIIAYLQEHGYDGLWCGNGDCSCTPDDLAPCSEMTPEYCQPGVKVPCTCEMGCEFHIGERETSE